MGYSIDVYDHNFEEEVLEKSYETPVIVDFFATWCGPCQMLKPMLEKVASEYECIVAKVNVEENQSMAQAFRVEGVPDVKIISQGKIIEGFVGVLPEPKLRALLAKCEIKSEVEEGLNAIATEIESGNLEKAKPHIEYLLTHYPENRQVLIEAAKFSIAIDETEKAQELLSPIQPDEKEYFAEAQAVKALILFKKECTKPAGDSELDRLFSQAACLTLEGNYEEALKQFLEIVETDRKYKNDGGRKAMISIFDLLGDEHPLTKEYRKNLMMALY